MNISTFEWNKYFPFDTPRELQITAINFILDSFLNKKKKYVILESPVGTGKSAIAITIANYFKDSVHSVENKKSTWLLTTQKLLQLQYKNEFNYLANVWSKTNYECVNKIGVSCQLGSWMNKIFKNSYCDCIYTKDRNAFLNSEISITNMQFFLNQVEYNTDKIFNRKLLIVDEAHNIENNIIDFVSITLDKYIITHYGLNWIGYNKSINDIVEWCSETVIPRLSQVKNSLNDKIKISDKDKLLKTAEGKLLLKQIDDLDRYICQLERCVSRFNGNEWVMSSFEEDSKIVLKPLFASRFTHQRLFKTADQVLLMSGTILDKNTYCKNLGIDINDAEFISLPSPFPIENRRIFVLSSGSLTYKDIDKSLPNIVKAIKQLVDKEHSNVKGIIHAGSYKISKYIVDNFKSNRLLTHNQADRMEIYKVHLTSPKPTVLLSPSLTEGIDLVDDLSRFQIIVKVPYPSLGDEYVKQKMNRVPGWYSWETAKTIIQSYGRSIRNENDFSTTYILDSNFTWFYKNNEQFFPKWFKDALFFI